MTDEKKRKSKAKWDTEKEIGLLSMVLEINPYIKAHVTKEKVWNHISDRLNVKGGTDGAACKAKVVALIKTYQLEKEENLKTTGCTDNDDGEMD